MFDFLKKPIFLIILAVALIGAGLWAYFSNRAQEQKAAEEQAAVEQVAEEAVISNLTNADPNAYNDQLKNQLTLANTKAVEADRRNTLVAVEVHLPADLKVNSGDTSYVYSSTGDGTNNWLITISNSADTFLRARVPKEDYLGTLKAINESYWKLNYLTALQIAEKNGGLDFRNANDITEVKLTLKNADPKSFLYWFVVYTSDTNAKQIQIDASTGAIVTE